VTSQTDREIEAKRERDMIETDIRQRERERQMRETQVVSSNSLQTVIRPWLEAAGVE
jgi:hypothetical protein